MAGVTALQAEEIAAAIAEIEALGPDVAWSFGTITNDRHMMHPFGKGVCVTINGPGTEAHPNPVTVFQKARTSFAQAVEQAVQRYKLRQAGHSGA